MKKLRKFLFLLLAIVPVIFVSCASSSGTVIYPPNRFEGILPYRHMEVGESISQDMRSVTAGTITGEATVALYPDMYGVFKGDSGKYASLSYPEEESWFLGILETSPEGFNVALSNATAEMLGKMQELGASYVIFPSFSVDLKDDYITVKTTATACKVISE